MSLDSIGRQRKFTLAMIFTITTVLALMFDKITGGEFIGAMDVILGLYGAANVGQRYVESNQE